VEHFEGKRPMFRRELGPTAGGRMGSSGGKRAIRHADQEEARQQKPNDLFGRRRHVIQKGTGMDLDKGEKLQAGLI